MDPKELDALRPMILEICARHGVTSVRVFGSVARGDAGSESDLDLLVTVGPEPGPWFPGGLIADLEARLGCRVDIVTERALNEDVRDEVLAEAFPL